MTKANSIVTSARSELPCLVGGATTVFFYTAGNNLTSDHSNLPLSGFSFLWLFAVMIWCAFGVVRHADVLAKRLGEPYGTLILTLSVVSIEVTIMATVMLSGQPNPTLPRDTVMAVLMIVLNGMVGVSVLIGAVRHNQQQYNLEGAVAFLAVIATLVVISLVIPTFTKSTSDTSMTVLQASTFGVVTALVYGAFLLIQTVRHQTFFLEPASGPKVVPHAVQAKVHQPSPHSTLYHTFLLVATLLPVVLLSKPLAKLIDFGIEELGAPTAVGGIVIAILVLSPEGLSSFQAASRNELQRSVNLSLGSALSTIGLTIPVMLMISLATGMTLELGLEPVGIALLALTLFLARMTFSGAPTNILFGVLHLVVFLAFCVLVFSP